MPELKILFLSDVDYFKGGAEKSLFDVMATPDILPVLCTPAYGPLTDAAQEKGIECVSLDFGKVLNVHRPFKLSDGLKAFTDVFKAAKKLKEIAYAQGAVAIHSNGLKAHGIACLARLLGSVPIITHYRSIPHTGSEKLFWRVTQKIASKVILVSRACWPGRVLPENAQIVFNGVPAFDSQVLPITQELGAPVTLGFVGRIHPDKGLHIAVSWLASLRSAGMDVRLVIRGEAVEADKPYEERVKKEIRSNGLESLCVFEGQKEGYEAIYGGIDIVLVPSIVPDPLPRVCMEAAALGIPVLAYPEGGIPNMVSDRKTGFLAYDEQDAYKALKVLTGDKWSYGNMSRAAREHAKENFSLRKLHETLQQIYAQI